MTVEEILRGKLGDENDKFPVGLSVLAVDDDMTCLKLLERLLMKCQYQVTTTNQAKVALEMLRENRNRFDIIITDVHMPDMDGLKLLELVGLEMDLPVIMLSANSDPKMVMKGISHGACDYLVKPVRIEELKNIWQHVIRRKKRELKQKNSDPQKKDQQGNGESGNRTSSNASSDQNGKRSNRKIKDEEEDGEESGTDNDEPGTQKKPRVVWSVDLHRKFVAAVNHLGIGKEAVPKKILEHMNVEGLSRENVASHLQKYRLYLKRISSVASQANTLSAGGKDPYMRMNPFGAVGDFRALASSQGRFSNSAMSSYQTGAMLNRLNTPSGGSPFGLSSSSPLIQANNHGQRMSNSFPTLTKFDPGVLQPNQSSNPFQVIPKPSELNQFHPSKSASYMGNINSIGSSINYLPSAQKNIISNGGIFSNRGSEPFNASTGHNNFNNGVFSNFSSHPNSFSEAFNRDPLVPNGSFDNNISSGGIMNNPLDLSSIDVISTSVHDSRGEGLLGNFTNTKSWVPVNGVMGPFSHSFDQNNGIFQRKTDLPSTISQNSEPPLSLQCNESEKLAMEPKTKPNGDYFMEQWRSQGAFGRTRYDALDELLMNSTTKVEQEGNMMFDGEFGIDSYTF